MGKFASKTPEVVPSSKGYQPPRNTVVIIDATFPAFTGSLALDIAYQHLLFTPFITGSQITDTCTIYMLLCEIPTCDLFA